MLPTWCMKITRIFAVSARAVTVLFLTFVSCSGLL
ncbi:hypothetical protein CSUI_000357 [Cystoisospora suis]|uniref:Transmembrane protein n=1 Tax=Cystoisospora suis TaxID=483139 RepID=A0A2C6LHJ5_9APIC|nr:hypothetical protein CSUI_000357 [Cystoisospora suis]